ncbi:peptide/nickel transport system substrate-binding protein [Paenibacillus algorifonticola]|uniref:Peptide/nickel transport system substrate-binding protein n=1 Tax=Paenibacillus algorifonticola TaxID=684063 RepID=A0A1I1YJP7_9BACL|nr:nickel ABC transporter substrate-binding protein [Paenibacillus algorifonticola]SFE19776.1 peptide/nickel transport system substrate-binding protein [Paenibacillus algorifonticola]
MLLLKENKRNKRLFFTILLLVLSMVVAGCGKSANSSSETGNTGQNATAAAENKAGKTLTLLYHFKSGSLDPHNDYIVLKAGVVETLVRMDDKLELQPWLASKWESVDDSTWRFTIREGVTFHSGAKLDAAAVKASLERGIGVNKALDTTLKIASMKAEGQELTITTTEPLPAFPSELVNPYSGIIDVAAEKTMGTEAFNKAPVGTGPFQIKGFTPNMEINLARYDSYWDGAALLEEIKFKFNEDGNVRALALQAKEADLAFQLPAEMVDVIKQDQNLKIESLAGLRAHFLLYNQQQPALKDVLVRQALDLLIDRESMAKDVMLGNASAANGPFNANLPFGSQEAVQPLDTEKAKQLLEQAGYAQGSSGKLEKDGKPLTLEVITYKGRPELPLIAQLLQSDAAKIGVTLTIKTVENVDTYLRDNNDWNLATYSNLTAPRGDGGFFLNSAFIVGGSLNPANISNDELSAIIAQLNATGDVAERVKLTQAAAAVIKAQALHSYAVYPNIIVGMNKKVTGWTPGPEEYYLVTNKMDVS